MSRDTPEDDVLGPAKTMTAEIGALIDRTDAAIEQTQEAIRRVREASKADATLARAMDAANKDADDGSARA